MRLRRSPLSLDNPCFRKSTASPCPLRRDVASRWGEASDWLDVKLPRTYHRLPRLSEYSGRVGEDVGKLGRFHRSVAGGVAGVRSCSQQSQGLLRDPATCALEVTSANQWGRAFRQPVGERRSFAPSWAAVCRPRMTREFNVTRATAGGAGIRGSVLWSLVT